MIDITAIEQPDRRRVVCLTIIDGKEYDRLGAFAAAMNRTPYLERDNTPATVYANFFTCSCDLDGDAGARLLGQTFEEYWDGVIEGLFDTLLDVAEQKTGKREIPLTRHEMAALARCEAATKDERKGTENHEVE